MKIYHNPRCRKSRETLALLNEHGVQVEIILYLKEHPTVEELTGVVQKLGIPAEKLLRKGEPIFKEHYKGKQLNEQEYIAAMIEHPKLIERPIVIKGDKAIIGRPPELVLSLL